LETAPLVAFSRLTWFCLVLSSSPWLISSFFVAKEF